MKYYIAENGQPAGPFELDELRQHGLNANSQVWNESMSGWTRASEVPELAGLLQPEASPYAPEASPYAPQQPEADNRQQQGYGQQPSPYAQPQYQQPAQPQYPQQPQQPYPQQPQQPYQQQSQQYPQQQGFAPKNWMTESIVLTVLSAICCCNPISLVTGIVAIVYASKVNNLFRCGNVSAAAESAKQAKMWVLITLGVLVLGLIVSVATVLGNREIMDTLNSAALGEL